MRNNKCKKEMRSNDENRTDKKCRDFITDSDYMGICFCGTERGNGLCGTIYF